MGYCGEGGSESGGSAGVIHGIQAGTTPRRSSDREGNGQAHYLGAAADGRAADDLPRDLHAGANAGAEAPQKSEATAAPAPAPTTPTAGTAPRAGGGPFPEDAPAVPERTAVIETPLYRAAIATARRPGQGLGSPLPGREIHGPSGTVDTAGWVVKRPGQPARPIAFALSTESVKLDKDTPTGELRMVGEDGFGIRVTQVLRFRADTYVVEHELKVENRHTVAQAVELVHVWTRRRSGPRRRSSSWERDRSTSPGSRRDRSGLGASTSPRRWTTWETTAGSASRAESPRSARTACT